MNSGDRDATVDPYCRNPKTALEYVMTAAPFVSNLRYSIKMTMFLSVPALETSGSCGNVTCDIINPAEFEVVQPQANMSLEKASTWTLAQCFAHFHRFHR
jgi:hypothetical protein